MAKRRREPISEGKKNIIAGLIQEYDIKTAEDIQDALKDLLGSTIQAILEAEMDEHLGYEPYERSENSNSRNGKKSKTIRSKYGEMEIDVP
ncbi:transposase, partial [Acetivibrio clariflavus]